MKCKKCGNEFDEGIFCPECGTKNEDKPQMSEEDIKELERQQQERIEREHQEKERQEQERREKERLAKERQQQEKERLERERKEAEVKAKEREARAKAEQENAEAKRLEQENAKREMESRTVKGVMYKTFEEAEQARNEHKKIDLLKEKLLSTKSQKKRQEIFSEFNEPIEIRETKFRYDLLADKINTVPPKSEMVCKIYGYTVLVMFVICMVDAMIATDEMSTLGLISMLWAGFGCWIWPIWKIVQVIKSKSANHYKNIKKI